MYETVVGRTLVVTGKIRATNSVRVDGVVNGPLHIDQKVLVAETGTVNGNIEADEIEIAGRVVGDIVAQTIILTATARVIGDVYATRLDTAIGAFIDGRITMQKDEDIYTETASASWESS